MRLWLLAARSCHLTRVRQGATRFFHQGRHGHQWGLGFCLGPRVSSAGLRPHQWQWCLWSLCGCRTQRQVCRWFTRASSLECSSLPLGWQQRLVCSAIRSVCRHLCQWWRVLVLHLLGSTRFSRIRSSLLHQAVLPFHHQHQPVCLGFGMSTFCHLCLWMRMRRFRLWSLGPAQMMMMKRKGHRRGGVPTACAGGSLI